MRKDFTDVLMPTGLAVLAADVGGTRIRAAAILGDGRVSLRRERPTRMDRGPVPLAEDVAALLREVAEAAAAQGLALESRAAIARRAP